MAEDGDDGCSSKVAAETSDRFPAGIMLRLHLPQKLQRLKKWPVFLDNTISSAGTEAAEEEDARMPGATAESAATWLLLSSSSLAA